MSSGSEIKNFDNSIEAFDKRHKFFHETGCRLSDHGLIAFILLSSQHLEINRIFKKFSKGNPSRLKKQRNTRQP